MSAHFPTKPCCCHHAFYLSSSDVSQALNTCCRHVIYIIHGNIYNFMPCLHHQSSWWCLMWCGHWLEENSQKKKQAYAKTSGIKWFVLWNCSIVSISLNQEKCFSSLSKAKPICQMGNGITLQPGRASHKILHSCHIKKTALLISAIISTSSIQLLQSSSRRSSNSQRIVFLINIFPSLSFKRFRLACVELRLFKPHDWIHSLDTNTKQRTL